MTFAVRERCLENSWKLEIIAFCAISCDPSFIWSLLTGTLSQVLPNSVPSFIPQQATVRPWKSNVPCIDLSLEDSVVAEDIRNACIKFGFFTSEKYLNLKISRTLRDCLLLCDMTHWQSEHWHRAFFGGLTQSVLPWPAQASRSDWCNTYAICKVALSWWILHLGKKWDFGLKLCVMCQGKRPHSGPCRLVFKSSALKCFANCSQRAWSRRRPHCWDFPPEQGLLWSPSGREVENPGRW